MTKGGSIWESVKKQSSQPTPGKIDPQKLQEVYDNIGNIYNEITSEVAKTVAGQKKAIEGIIIAIFTDNHALLEGFPGLGKTLTVRTLAEAMDLKFRRIQCTPDLMPSDVTGTYLVEEDDVGRKRFRFEKGPVFTNLLLADEINRATPKSQSALLESMQERQVTIGNETHKLDKPFLVLATQNPIEMEGTYPLPEAQVDRFLMKIMVDYPTHKEEEKIIDWYTSERKTQVRKVVSAQDILTIQYLVRKMPLSEEVKKHALNIVSATRNTGEKGTAAKYLDYGASPRASIGLVLAGKAKALINGQNYVSKKDIEEMAYLILRHRIILNFESERKGMHADDVISEILKEV